MLVHSNIISSLFNIKKRYLRSTDIERDFKEITSLNGYILTDTAKDKLLRLFDGLSLSSTQRAWRITGDYGTGKSSFALLIARLFSGQAKSLPSTIKHVIDKTKLCSFSTKLFPIIITGSREPVRNVLLKAVYDNFTLLSTQGRELSLLKKIESEIQMGTVSDTFIIQTLIEASIYINNIGKGNGLLLIIDEMGKFLEYAALHPEEQDVFFFQKLAEAAMRSGNTPLFIIGILHQGFNAYADQMSQSSQKEWMKVAGRFDELRFNQPLEQLMLLTSNALNIDENKLPTDITEFSNKLMIKAISLGWFNIANNQNLVSLASNIYPLHPSVLPVIVHLLRRFGQNERSLFSFLLSNEPHGLQDFATKKIEILSYYRICNLYDYIRHNFGYRLAIQSYRSHWNLIESLIESYRMTSELELNLLKTIGLLNLVDTSTLLATKDVLVLALSDQNNTIDEISSAIEKLENKKIIYYRGISGGYCLWPYTSVNLEKVYEDASNQTLNANCHFSR
ncbi:MAG: hypothetical protein HQK96_18245 [Nitrospirae bacterium]|nr:hypothetical protein [Nitrospirota bacterium]